MSESLGGSFRPAVNLDLNYEISHSQIWDIEIIIMIIIISHETDLNVHSLNG